VGRVSVLAPEFDHSSKRNWHRWRGACVGQTLGAEEIGACPYELAGGQRVHRYHFHHEPEEWLIVVAGTPTARAPDGEHVLRRGDVVCFPPSRGLA
jgi:uncharacterized cupin superfamily protein